jgi:hypothetical protein
MTVMVVAKTWSFQAAQALVLALVHPGEEAYHYHLGVAVVLGLDEPSSSYEQKPQPVGGWMTQASEQPFLLRVSGIQRPGPLRAELACNVSSTPTLSGPGWASSRTPTAGR